MAGGDVSEAEAGIDQLGRRAKIGVLVPATNTVAAPECEALRPPGVTNHVSRMAPAHRPTDDMKGYRASIGRGEQAARDAIDLVVPCELGAILLGHSIDSFLGGVAGAKQLAARLTEHAGVPVIVPSLAASAALEKLGGIRRIALLTPYMPPGDEVSEAFFVDAGFEVRRVLGLRCAGALAIAEVPAERIEEALDELDGDDVEAIVQAGTNLPMAHLIAGAEARLGKPVLSINVAGYWQALRDLGVDDAVPGYGALLER
jgi:maleate isomerase